MAHLQIGPAALDADLVVFDKDGTLVDFHGVWGGRALRAVRALELDEATSALLYACLGYDPRSGRVDGGGRLAAHTHDMIEQAVLEALTGAGLGAGSARAAIEARFAPIMRGPPQPEGIRAIGDLGALLARLAGAGVQLAVLTSDDRTATESTLRQLGLDGHFARLVCGDDPIAHKPAPDGILHIAAALRAAPQRCLMVGDTFADMRAGRAAGARTLGVTSGAASAAQLATEADLVAGSVHAIEVVAR